MANQPDGGGLRYNEGKRPWHLVPWDALAAVVDVFAAGAKKYAPRNWERGQPYSTPFASLLRHLLAWWGGEERDPDTGCRHIAMVVWNGLALLTYEVRGMGQIEKDGVPLDDRPRAPLAQGMTDLGGKLPEPVRYTIPSLPPAYRGQGGGSLMLQYPEYPPSWEPAPSEAALDAEAAAASQSPRRSSSEAGGLGGGEELLPATYVGIAEAKAAQARIEAKRAIVAREAHPPAALDPAADPYDQTPD
jgi:hypothetical protein